MLACGGHRTTCMNRFLLVGSGEHTTVILRGKMPWPTEPSSCLTLFFNYRVLIIHKCGFMIFPCMDKIYFSHVHPLPSLVLPLPLTCFLFHPAHYCRVCVCGCVGVCVTYWVSLGWETKVYDVNFMTYSTQLNFKYMLNNKFKFI